LQRGSQREKAEQREMGNTDENELGIFHCERRRVLVVWRQIRVQKIIKLECSQQPRAHEQGQHDECAEMNLKILNAEFNLPG
jgi:hypothetical protein